MFVLPHPADAFPDNPRAEKVIDHPIISTKERSE
jgi:hypothetical protein